jgi:8-oxo-dGTP pyrophosphatase MutT (NUDIX family)
VRATTPHEILGVLDVFDLDAGQVREEGIETLLVTCSASSPTPDPAAEPFPSRNVSQNPDPSFDTTRESLIRQPCNVHVFVFRRTGPEPEYALFRRSDDGSWQSVAGGVEEDESLLQAARRETREESGLPASLPEVMGCSVTYGRASCRPTRNPKAKSSPRSLTVVVGGDLDEVAVRITEVDRGDRASRPSPGNWSFLDPHVAGAQVGHHPVKWGRGDQADIDRSWSGSAGLGLQLVTRLVQVELVGAEAEGAAVGAEGDRLHAEHADIEVDGLVDVGNGEDQMVNAVDDHRCAWRCWRTHAASVPEWSCCCWTGTARSNGAPALTGATTVRSVGRPPAVLRSLQRHTSTTFGPLRHTAATALTQQCTWGGHAMSFVRLAGPCWRSSRRHAEDRPMDPLHANLALYRAEQRSWLLSSATAWAGAVYADAALWAHPGTPGHLSWRSTW